MKTLIPYAAKYNASGTMELITIDSEEALAEVLVNHRSHVQTSPDSHPVIVEIYFLDIASDAYTSDKMINEAIARSIGQSTGPKSQYTQKINI